VDEVARATDISVADFKRIGDDGVFSAEEIAGAFGTSADGIISAMDGATDITLDALLAILDTGEFSAGGILKAFTAAGYDLSDGMISGVDEIQKAIDSLTGANIQSYHTITTIGGSGGGADSSDSRGRSSASASTNSMAFATGGSFIARGAFSGTDQLNLGNVNVSAGEKVIVQTPQQQTDSSGLQAEILEQLQILVQTNGDSIVQQLRRDSLVGGAL